MAVLACRDIAKTKKAFLHIKSRAEEIASILDNSADIIVVCHNGKIGYITPSVTRIIGYRREDMIGKSCYGFVDPASRHIMDKILSSASYKEAKDMSFRIQVVARKGKKVYFELKPSLIEAGRKPKVQIIARDITEKVMLERARDSLLKKEEFISTLSFKLLHSSWQDVDRLLNESLHYLGMTLNVDSVIISLTEREKVEKVFIWRKTTNNKSIMMLGHK